MLTRDILFEGFTVEQWTRLLSLFDNKKNGAPGLGLDAIASPVPDGGVVALYQPRPDGSEVLRKLVHTQRGRLPLREQAWPIPLADLAEQNGARWAAAIAVGTLEEVSELFGARAKREHDLTAQMGELFRILRELAKKGLVRTHPRDIDSLPFATRPALARSLDALCPNGRTAVVGVFDAGELWTAVAVERKNGGFCRVVGPSVLRPPMGLLSGDFRRDHRHLASVVRERMGALSFGCFAELSTLRALEGGVPGGWAHAVVVRDIILEPMPLSLTVPLVADAARATWASLRDTVRGWNLGGKMPPLFRPGRATRSIGR